MYVPISLGPREKIIEELSKGQFKHTHCYRPYGCGEAWELERYVDSRVSGNKDLYPREYPYWEKLVELLGEKQPLDLLRKFNEVMKRCPEYAGDYEGSADRFVSWDIHKAIAFIKRSQSDELLSKADIEYLSAKINDLNLIENGTAAEWASDYFGQFRSTLLNPHIPLPTDILLPELQDVSSLGAKAIVLVAIRTYFADEMWLERIDQDWNARNGLSDWLQDDLRGTLLSVSVGWVPYIYRQHKPRIEKWIDELSAALADKKPKRTPKVRTEKTPNAICFTALKQYHEYEAPIQGEPASVGKLQPIGVRQMEQEYNIARNTASRFFKDIFTSHSRYKNICRTKEIAKKIYRLGAMDWDRTRPLHDSYEPKTYDSEPTDI